VADSRQRVSLYGVLMLDENVQGAWRAVELPDALFADDAVGQAWVEPAAREQMERCSAEQGRHQAALTDVEAKRADG